MTSSCVQEGDHVIFKRKDGSSKVFQIRKNRQVYYEKSKLDVENLIGQTYGSTFEIDRGKLVKLETEIKTEGAVGSGAMASYPTADNRNLLDLDSNQRMSKEDIMRMKDEGITAEKIIEELVENSETFKSKTEFAQAKYLKKKKKKHMLVFTVLKPNPRLVMEIFAKEPTKICCLRVDSLSQLLNYSNVMSGSRVAVVESCQGLVVACVLQRMGGEGKLVQLIPNMNNTTCRLVVDYFSFPKAHLDNLYTFSLDILSTLDPEYQAESVDSAKKDEAAAPVADTTQSVDAGRGEETNRIDGDDKQEVEAEEQGRGEMVVHERELQRRLKADRQREAGEILKSRQLDSLIIACKYNPTPILIKLLNFLPPSRPVVVFCQYIDPLIECYTYIKEKHLGLQVRLSESWLREYQILPQRTHPMVNMSGTGGYMLTFMTSLPSTPAASSS